MFAKLKSHISGAVIATQSDRQDLVAQSLLLLWAFWLSAEYLVFGRYSYALLHDFGDSFIPYYLGEGRAGLWSFLGGWEPRMLAGVDAAANTISQFRLTSLSAAVMPVWLSIGLFALLQRAIAGVFMYRVLVDVFGGHRGVSFAAAMLFAVGMGPLGAEAYYGFTHNMGLAPSGLPFLVWAHWRWANSRPMLLLGVMFVSGALLALATMMFISIQVLVCFALVLVAITPARRWLTLLPPLVALGLGYTALELPNVVAVMVDWQEAHRIHNPVIPVADRLHASLNALRQMATFHAVPVLAVLLSLFIVGWKAIPGRLAAVLGLCAVILFLDSIFAAVVDRPGTLVNFSFVRIAFVMPFLLILIAGIALSRMFSADGIRQRAGVIRGFLPPILAIGIVATAIGQDAWIKFNNLRYYSHGSNYAVLYDQPPLRKVAALIDDRNPFRVATVTVTDVTHLNRASFPWAYGLETVDGYVNVFPRRYHELWVEVIRKAAATTPVFFEKMRDWGNHLYLTVPGPDCDDIRLGDSANLDLLSLLNVRFIVSPCPLQDARLRLFAANRDGPGQSWHGRSNREKLLTVFRRDFPARELFVYENPVVLPRYFLTGAARIFETPSAALRALGAADRQTLRSTAVVVRQDLGEVSLPQGPPGTSGTVRIVSVGRNEISLEITAERKSVLVVGNSYNRRWTAMVNGESRTVFRADHALQGLVVDGGRSRVVLRYQTALSRLLGYR